MFFPNKKVKLHGLMSYEHLFITRFRGAKPRTRKPPFIHLFYTRGFLVRRVIVFPLLIVLLSIIVTGFGCKKKGPEALPSPLPAPEVPPGITSTTPASLPVSPPVEFPPSSEKTTLERELSILAQDFSEVWGTFSNETNCQNIRDLLDYMSGYFRGEMEDYIEEECVQEYGGPPFEWKTEVLDSIILEQGKERAEILVVTKRVKKTGEYTKTYYINLILDLVVETNTRGEDEWRVDDVYWLEQ